LCIFSFIFANLSRTISWNTIKFFNNNTMHDISFSGLMIIQLQFIFRRRNICHEKCALRWKRIMKRKATSSLFGRTLKSGKSDLALLFPEIGRRTSFIPVVKNYEKRIWSIDTKSSVTMKLILHLKLIILLKIFKFILTRVEKLLRAFSELRS